MKFSTFFKNSSILSIFDLFPDIINVPRALLPISRSSQCLKDVSLDLTKSHQFLSISVFRVLSIFINSLCFIDSPHFINCRDVCVLSAMIDSVHFINYYRDYRISTDIVSYHRFHRFSTFHQLSRLSHFYRHRQFSQFHRFFIFHQFSRFSPFFRI